MYFAAAGCEAVLLGEVRHHQAPALQIPVSYTHLQTLSKKEKELAAVQKKATLTKEALIHARDLDYIGKINAFKRLAPIVILSTRL